MNSVYYMPTESSLWKSAGSYTQNEAQKDHLQKTLVVFLIAIFIVLQCKAVSRKKKKEEEEEEVFTFHF